MAQYDLAEYWVEKYDEVYEKYQHAQDRITELEAERDAIRNATLEEVAQMIEAECPISTKVKESITSILIAKVRQMKEVQGDKG